MSHSFAITTTTNNLAIMAGERQSVSFTVSNISRVAVRGRVAVVPQGATPAGWFALIGEAERDFVPAENEQFTYEIVVPPETPSGRHLFSARIVNVDIDKIEEDFADSPVVALDVTAAGSVTQPITAGTLDQIARLANANMSGDVFAVGYSDPAGLHRLAVGSGTTIQIWQFGPELALVCTLNSAETITSLDISAGGNWLASGGADGEVRIWDIDTCGTSREFIYAGSEHVAYVAFLNEEYLLAASPYEITARIYALADGIYASPREIELSSDAQEVLSSANGQWLGQLGTRLDAFILTDIAAGEYAGFVIEDPWYYPTFTFSNNSEFVALVHGENLELLRLDAITAPEEYTAEKVWVAPFSGDWTTVLAFSPTDELLAAIVRNQLEWRRAVDGSLLVTTNIGPFGWKWLAFSADGTYLVLAADDGVEIWGIPKR